MRFRIVQLRQFQTDDDLITSGITRILNGRNLISYSVQIEWLLH